MKLIEYAIPITKAGRFFSGIPLKKIEKTIFLLHGYAQLAKDFIEEFEFLADDHTLLVAPEGLSKFYSKNKPAASWMTKEDRENEINDYIQFLERVYGYMMVEFDIRDSKRFLIGFSQGVHTAARWFINSEFRFDKLVLCSSDFPMDVDLELLKSKLKKSKMYYIFGTQDPILTGSTQFVNGFKTLADSGVKFETISFEGKHTIDQNSIVRAIK